jgi:hypothetical protein
MESLTMVQKIAEVKADFFSVRGPSGSYRFVCFFFFRQFADVMLQCFYLVACHRHSGRNCAKNLLHRVVRDAIHYCRSVALR